MLFVCDCVCLVLFVVSVSSWVYACSSSVIRRLLFGVFVACVALV